MEILEGFQERSLMICWKEQHHLEGFENIQIRIYGDFNQDISVQRNIKWLDFGSMWKIETAEFPD